MSNANDKPVKRIVSEETMCCGYKRCPVVRIYDDGSIDIDDDDAERGEQHIAFNPDQAAALKALLGK